MRSHPVLQRLAMAGVRLGLDRMRDVLRAMGEPHLAVPVIHVAGTNGKGSVCTYVTQALVAAGYRVGTNLSPHLEHVNERIQLDGVPIRDAELAAAIEHVDRVRLDWAELQGLQDDVLTYFELMTAAAFHVFAQRQVDVAVIEVGMGGRLDATNVVQPLVTAITSIGLDHQAELGDTVALIAAEKAGILKPGAPVSVGPLPAEAMEVVRARARAVGCEAWTAGSQLRRERRGDRWVLSTPDGVVGPVRLGMEGAHQGANASVAVGVLHLLRRQGMPVSDEAIAAGFAAARVPGRVERLVPGLVVDGGHNPDGTAALAAWLAEQPRPASRILLFGMGEGRDPRALLTPLLPHFDEVVLTRCAHPHAMAPAAIAAALGPVDVALSDGGAVEECLDEVRADADEVVVAGSLFLAGAVRELVAGDAPG